MEFGCGDGNQLSLANYPKYIGLDISPTIIESCKEKFRKDASKAFYENKPSILQNNKSKFESQLGLSIDVIFHLVEDEVYSKYMTTLFRLVKLSE
ncbi:methyltransferase domain-containing protein [Botryobacter ruber]|uniref:methyltransferase domain-containing protein n=1 Tax=Botryobacter ruber TaxID=2171629 RepID=UPI000E0B6AD4